jgi:hypothetical protein
MGSLQSFQLFKPLHGYTTPLKQGQDYTSILRQSIELSIYLALYLIYRYTNLPFLMLQSTTNYLFLCYMIFRMFYIIHTLMKCFSQRIKKKPEDR